MVPDLATRVYNHTFRIDPIVRTLLDTDFYKLLMLQMIWRLHRQRRVTFQLINRTSTVRLADIVEERELIDQLDHARSLRLANNELCARAAMRGMSRFDLDVLYARAKAKLWSKVERLRALKREGPLRISDFGTRRRHG